MSAFKLSGEVLEEIYDARERNLTEVFCLKRNYTILIRSRVALGWLRKQFTLNRYIALFQPTSLKNFDKNSRRTDRQSVLILDRCGFHTCSYLTQLLKYQQLLQWMKFINRR